MNKFEILKKKEILKEKIADQITSKGVLNQQNLNEIVIESSSIEDHLIATDYKNEHQQRVINFVNDEDNGLSMDYRNPENKSSQIGGLSFGDITNYVLHPNALYQLFDKSFSPSRGYINKLLDNDWGKTQLAAMLNSQTLNIPKKLIFRTLETEGQSPIIKGVVSNSYKAFNTYKIVSSFVKSCQNLGAKAYEVVKNDLDYTLTFINPEVKEIKTEKNGIVYSVFGARLRSSDFGHGALTVKTFQMNCVCLNGMISETVMKSVHRGSRKEILSQKAADIESDLIAQQIEDMVSEALSEEAIQNVIDGIKAASEQEIDAPKKLNSLSSKITKEEIESIKNLLIDSNAELGLEGSTTTWKLSQAINAYGNTCSSYERKQAMEQIAGSLVIPKRKLCV